MAKLRKRSIGIFETRRSRSTEDILSGACRNVEAVKGRHIGSSGGVLWRKHGELAHCRTVRSSVCFERRHCCIDPGLLTGQKHLRSSIWSQFETILNRGLRFRRIRAEGVNDNHHLTNDNIILTTVLHCLSLCLMCSPASLPYIEPSIITILILTSFLLLLNVINSVLDRLIYYGLIGQLLLSVAYSIPGVGWTSIEIENVISQLGYLGLILLVYGGGRSTSIGAVRVNLRICSSPSPWRSLASRCLLLFLLSYNASPMQLPFEHRCWCSIVLDQPCHHTHRARYK